MHSRRSVRIKVMQLLYSLNRDEQLSSDDLVKSYNEGIQETYSNYIFHLNLLMRVAQQSERDASYRASKVLPSESDKKFKPILYTNDLLQSLATHKGFRQLVDKYGVNNNLDDDLLRRIYQSFLDTDESKAYLSNPEPQKEDHYKVIYDLYRFLNTNDIAQDMTEDRFCHWPDDETLVVGAMKKTLKMMPLTTEFYKEYESSDETVRFFGEELLKMTCREDAALFSEIEPLLQNWEADRVAILDMIMLKMALCELLHFPTIPTKVTLNEFVEVSKIYSTDKSKEFINGILDRLMKKLTEEGKISKEGRGLIEN
jgi:transcription antitermination protein NusB